jgi:hypothetical protein
MRAVALQVTDSLKRATEDSIARARRPRRIHVTVTNRISGGRVANAGVLTTLSRHEYLDSTMTRANARGEFTAVNPPIGGIIFDITCPGMPIKRRHSIGESGLYVGPGLDTLIAIEVSSVEPCWTSRRARPVMSGELESDFYRNSPFPGTMEREVYRAVLEELLSKRDLRPPVLLKPLATPRCGIEDETCGVTVLQLLAREGVIDTTIIARFERRKKPAAPFNPWFANDLPVKLVSPGEAEYLKKEAGGRRFDGEDLYHVSDAFMRALRQVYPGARELVSFGSIAFSDDSAKALTEIRRAGTEWETRVETILLERRGNSWHVSMRNLEGQAISGAFRAEKCEVARPGPPPTIDELRRLDGSYRVEFVSTSGSPLRYKQSMGIQFTRRATDPSGVPEFTVRHPVTGARDERAEVETHIAIGKESIPRATDVMQLDGSGMLLEIRDVGPDTFSGSWEHYSFGVPVDGDHERLAEPAGYFCARKTPPA